MGLGVSACIAPLWRLVLDCLNSTLRPHLFRQVDLLDPNSPNRTAYSPLQGVTALIVTSGLASITVSGTSLGLTANRIARGGSIPTTYTAWCVPSFAPTIAGRGCPMYPRSCAPQVRPRDRPNALLGGRLHSAGPGITAQLPDAPWHGPAARMDGPRVDGRLRAVIHDDLAQHQCHGLPPSCHLVRIQAGWQPVQPSDTAAGHGRVSGGCALSKCGLSLHHSAIHPPFLRALQRRDHRCDGYQPGPLQHVLHPALLRAARCLGPQPRDGRDGQLAVHDALRDDAALHVGLRLADQLPLRPRRRLGLRLPAERGRAVRPHLHGVAGGLCAARCLRPRLLPARHARRRCVQHYRLECESAPGRLAF